MVPKMPFHDGRPYAHELKSAGGSLLTGVVTLVLRLLATAAAMAIAYGAFRLFGGAGLYIALLLFGAAWLSRELSWIDRNIPPED